MRLLFLLAVFILNIANIIGTYQAPIYDDSNATYTEYRESGNYQIIYCVRGYSHGADKFAKKLLEQVAKSDRNNLLISPFGISLTMSMAASGAKGDSDTVVSRALGLLKHEMQRRAGIQAIIDRLNAHKPMELEVSNGVFNSSRIALEQSYVASSKRAFRSSMQSVDFTRTAEARNVINEFVKHKTHSRIEKILDADNLHESTAVVTVNNMYFRGTWLKKFNADFTRESTFYLEDGSTKLVRSMNAKHVVRFGDFPKVKAKFIELPYLSERLENDVSMFVLLPYETDGLRNLESNFHKIGIRAFRKRGHYTTVNIRLPTLTIKSELQLNDPLTRMNMGILFNPQNASFGALTKTTKMFIDKVVQNAFIEINEQGSEAAATIGKTLRPVETNVTRKSNERPAEIYSVPSDDKENVETTSTRATPDWVWGQPISHDGSEFDAETGNATDFIVDRPFSVILATVTDEPEILWVARVTGLG